MALNVLHGSLAAGPGLTIGVATKKIVDALARASEETRSRFLGTINPDAASTRVTLRRGDELIDLLLEDLTLSAAQRKRLTLLKTSGEDIVDTPVHSARAMHDSLVALTKAGEPNLEFEMMGRWYPAEFSFKYENADRNSGLGPYLVISKQLNVGDVEIPVYRFVMNDEFIDDDGRQHPKQLGEVLRGVGLRLLENDPDDNTQRLARARRVAQGEVKPFDVRGPGLVVRSMGYHSEFRQIELGTARGGDLVIADNVTERNQRTRPKGPKEADSLPLLRVFVMALKTWAIVDVDDLMPHRFDDQALDKIVLDPKTRGILARVFNTPVEKFFGDLLDRRHGGMVICAAGPTGTGKTMTAECYAEQTHRVLYPLELSELGLEPGKIEENLQRVFRRVEAWNAVLLIDEADILMARRGADLSKNAIVGIFLRLLDYYRGMLFITSNRPQDFDEAFAGRVTMTIWYPELDAAQRREVWRRMLTAAGCTLKEGDAGLDRLGAMELNGRQIRNAVRVVEAVEGKDVSAETLSSVALYTIENVRHYAQ